MSGPDPEQERVQAALEAAAAALEERTAPDPEFERQLRARLLAVASVRGPLPARGPLRRRLQALRDTAASRRVRHRALVLTAYVAVVALLAVGLTIGTSRALPGSPLYGAKRTVEAIQVRSKDGPLEEGIARLHLAETRLREVRALSQGKHLISAGAGARGQVLAGGTDPAAAAAQADRVRATLATMDELTRSGGRLVEQVARSSGSGTPLAVLQAWAGMQSGHLQELTPDLPPAARERAAASLAVIQGLAATATALLAPGCLAPGATCPGTGPR